MHGNWWECRDCGVKRGLLVVYAWRPPTPWDRDAGRRGGHHYASASCVERASCLARRDKKRARAQQRAGMIVLEEPRAPTAPLGACRWCGDPILRDGLPDVRTRRRYHDSVVRPTKGNGYRQSVRDPAEPPCKDAWDASRVWDARVAIRRFYGPTLTCVDCGAVCEDEGTSYSSWAAWEADHELALEDGGEHTIANLKCRCVPCHRAKTARENAARRQVRAATNG